MRFFEESGWHVLEAKYGRRLQEAFARPGGELLRQHIDEMSNEEYQSLFALPGRRAPRAVPGPCRLRGQGPRRVSDAELAPLVRNLGGHDIGS